MSKYLRKFKNQTEYAQYISDDDIWLPRVSLIYNKGDAHTTTDKYNDNGPSRLEYNRIGSEFIQVANGGVMYFTDQIYENVEYKAVVEGDTIKITTRNLLTDTLTNDAYIDEENNQIVVNYPPSSATPVTISL